FKVAFVAVLVVGVYGYVSMKRGSMPKIPTSLSEIKSQIKIPAIPAINPSQAGKVISDTLDAFVTHPGRNLGPVVLGVRVTNESLGVITDTLLKLKPDQLQQIRNVVCQP
ncbi:MAG: hypothetical protein UX52_C0010G0018, partial [Candidatus Amesbacteria bacterium GW2011_GWA1_46_35]